MKEEGGGGAGGRGKLCHEQSLPGLHCCHEQSLPGLH